MRLSTVKCRNIANGDRHPAPGTQMQAGALLDAWVKTGAVCPN
jgi:hypothetical protein